MRRSLGRLRDLLVRPATRLRYSDAVRSFLQHIFNSGRRWPNTAAALDTLLSEHIEELWETGEPRSMAADALSGISHFVPHLRGCIRGSWRLLTAWQRSELPSRAPPLPKLWAYALAQYCFAQQWRCTGLFILLGFDTLARPMELFNATRSQFTFADDLTSGVWVLPHSKGGARGGCLESLPLLDPWIVKLLYVYMQHRGSTEPLSDVRATTHRTRLARAAAALNLDFGLRWYSIRRGGATEHFRRRRDMPTLMELGRWRSQTTARIYVTEGLQLLTEMAIPRATQQQLRYRAGLLRQDAAL